MWATALVGTAVGPARRACRLRDLVACNGGCGRIYWGEWAYDPPDECDACNDHGDWVGPRPCPPRGWLNLFSGLCGAPTRHARAGHPPARIVRNRPKSIAVRRFLQAIRRTMSGSTNRTSPSRRSCPPRRPIDCRPIASCASHAIRLRRDIPPAAWSDAAGHPKSIKRGVAPECARRRARRDGVEFDGCHHRGGRMKGRAWLREISEKVRAA